MVRAVSNVYALNGSSDAKMVISNMENTGPQSGEPNRLQVAYKHLDTGSMLNATYDTATLSDADALPDVAIILDEIGR